MNLSWISCPDPSSMKLVARLLSQVLPKKCLVYLQADLGMGKTFFSQAFIAQYGYSGKIKSPTYTLVEEYQCQNGPVLHFDLYRLADPEELEYIGIWDYLEQEAISFVEWPEKGLGVLPVADLILSIEDHKDGRKLKFSSDKESMAKVLQALRALLEINKIEDVPE